MNEIKGNTRELHENCQEDIELMQMIYQSAMDELEQLHQITRALVGGNLRKIFNSPTRRLLNVVSVNKPMIE
ncbi:MAG: hypothetical protein P0S93_04865 [Candidatus Neptunochlamydia sp.]|nr:hypothetical protein [Candidatus Neptunochlamydia sp.]